MMSRLALLPLLGLAYALALVVTYPAGVQAQSSVTAAAPVVLTDDQEEVPLGGHMEILADPTASLTIDDVTGPGFGARFTARSQDTPDFGRSPNAYWARIPVHNASTSPLWILAFDVYQQDHVDFYLQDESGHIVASTQTGASRPFSSRDLPTPVYAFQAPIPPGADATIFLRTAGEYPLRFPVSLQSVVSFGRGNDYRLLLTASLYGFLLLMAVYNLLMAAALRDRDHALLAGFIVGLTFTLGARDGRAMQFLWPEHPEASRVLVPLGIGLTLVFLLLFTASFLRTRALLPRIYRALTGMLALVAAATALVVPVALGWISSGTATTILLWLAIPSLALVILAGPLALKAGNRQARYFVAAVFLPFLAGIADLFVALGRLPISTLLTTIPLVGDVLLVLLFSLALADRVQALNLEVARHRDHLEELVVERTQELREANRELEEKQRVAETLREAATLLSASESQTAVLNQILRLLAQVVPYDGAAIYLDDGNGTGASDIVSVGAGGRAESDVGHRVALTSRDPKARVYNECRALVLDNAFPIEAASPVDGAMCSWVGLPLVADGKAFGILSIDYCEPAGYAASDLSLLEAFASQAATVVMNHRLYARAQVSAAAHERERLARDLHDAVTQTLFSASLIAQVLPQQMADDSTEALKSLEKLARLTKSALAEMRALLMELRPAALLAAPIDQRVDHLVQAASARSRIAFSYATHGDGALQLPADVQIAIYRIVQESLNNAIKHSDASRCLVDLWYLADGLEVAISDNGQGFHPEIVTSEHLGLGIMAERARAINADLVIDSEPDGGTHVRLCWRQQEKGGEP